MKTNQRGQVLLILILLSTVLLTVALSVSHVTTQETKIAKLEEDSKRAFAAAEAGIEAQLRKDVGATTAIDNTLIPSLGGFVTGSASTATDTTATAFYTDIRKDDQFTFYLNNYNTFTKQFSNSYSGNLTFYFLTCPTSTTCPSTQPVIELTFIGTNSTNIARKLIDPANVMQGASGTDTIPASQGAPSYNISISGKTYFFKYMTTATLPINANVKLMFIRTLIPGATTGTVGVAVQGSSALPPQGQTVTSTATTTTGVAKKITLFQSYPQIPATIFITSF